MRTEVVMKILTKLAILITLPLSAVAEEQSAQTLASTMDVFVFPTEAQDSGQQSMDEASCYDWATTNTGSDPFDLSKQAESDEELAAAEMQAAESTGQGAGARGAVRGAAAGAIVGEIVDDDASDGAKIGAAAGVIRGRRQGRAAHEQATEQAEQQADNREEATAEDLEDFKKAFSVCLEAKDYMVKY
jgi:hypothetical protein